MPFAGPIGMICKELDAKCLGMNVKNSLGSKRLGNSGEFAQGKYWNQNIHLFQRLKDVGEFILTWELILPKYDLRSTGRTSAVFCVI